MRSRKPQGIEKAERNWCKRTTFKRVIRDKHPYV